jgi:starch synthase
MHILMVAAENDGLPGGKVGGIGDVVRDAPPALAEQSCQVTVATPSYGFLHTLPGAERLTALTFHFNRYEHTVELYDVPGRKQYENVRHIVIHHPDFESYDSVNGRRLIYVDDPPDAPFRSDATKYALFCMAVTEGVLEGAFGRVDVAHLHDWHAAFFLILREFHEKCAPLKELRTVFTIHNLAYQGVRPLRGGSSSLEAWYAGLKYDPAKLVDPCHGDCVNPMAAGIRLADAVHTVSPSYAEEIMRPSDQERSGYYGGEGLESDLRQAAEAGRLFGILNGCDYPQDQESAICNHRELARLLRSSVLGWAGGRQSVSASHFIAYARLTELAERPEKPGAVVTSVSRVNEQKMRLLMEQGRSFASGLQEILQDLGGRGIYIMLGSGDAHYENFFIRMSSRFENFIFLNGYSDECSRALYANGDLFIMPSSYEPCGISQMLAMRDGQPCLVHSVGGLKDTVWNTVNGFGFGGENIPEQVDNMARTFAWAMEVKESNPAAWERIRQSALEARFLWRDSVRQYIEKLYTAH